jgi:2-polyprenyl-3-methyl-5-hydroxy-6-metoxy-1,4-benzoquinol methylase
MKEFEIRPRALFDEYLSVARGDIAIYFSDMAGFEEVPCPACDATAAEEAFVKHDFRYCTCRACGSLYASPRPTAAMIARYYRESASSKFWAERFFPETAEARRVQIFRPRAEMISQIIKQFGIPAPRVLADVGAGYGIFLEEMQRRGGLLDEIVAIEPSRALAQICRERGFRVIKNPIEEVTPNELRAAVITSFEVLEHVYAPADFLTSIHNLLLPGGLAVFTTLTISGWDLQVLWNQSKSISPPHHLNLLSIEGLEELVQRVGFGVVEIATPGELDVDIVRNMVAENPGLALPRFDSYLLRKRDGGTWQAFQEFLQEHRLSSHVRVVARKV